MSNDNDTAVTAFKRTNDEQNGPNKKLCTRDNDLPSNRNGISEQIDSSTHKEPPSLVIKEPPITYWLADGEQSKSQNVNVFRSNANNPF